MPADLRDKIREDRFRVYFAENPEFCPALEDEPWLE